MFESSPAESSGNPSQLEPHVPWGRGEGGAWLYAPEGRMLVVASGRLVVCHACGNWLSAVSAGHLRRHDLSLAGYRERFGLNRKTSLLAPELAEARRQEGKRRLALNPGVRDGLAVGQQMARTGELHELGVAAQSRGSRRPQGRVAASRVGASPALRAARDRQTSDAQARWLERVGELGFDSVEAYLVARVQAGATAHRVRVELGCGGSVAVRLLDGAGDAVQPNR